MAGPPAAGESRSAVDDVSFLLAGAAWQDSLLQSYRLLALSTQSIMLAVGALLLGAEYQSQDAVDVSLLFGSLVVVAAISSFAIARMRQVVVARGRDVNYWHVKLLEAERELVSQDRIFTRFKIEQKQQRQDLVDEFLGTITEETPDWRKLIEKSMGHTRRAIDQHLFAAMEFAWLTLVVVGLVHLLRVTT